MEKALNNKKTIRAWCMYDWANSVYNLTITTAIFPGYFEAVSQNAYNGKKIPVLGFDIASDVLFSYLLSLAFAIIIFVNLILAGISDVYGVKKGLLRIFSTIGAVACSLLYFFDSSHYWIGALFFVIATIGYAGSLVYYNSYLPVIAPPRLQDKVSALGFSYGYVGSVIMLVINLAIILIKPFGITETRGCQISFLMVGVWWLAFAFYAFHRLPADRVQKHQFSGSLLFSGIRDIIVTFKTLRSNTGIILYLCSFFLYSAGIQTIMYLSTMFGKVELKLTESKLIPIILVIQLIAIVGATLLAKLSKKMGNISTLAICCIAWIGICIGAYYTSDYLEFCILAVIVGFMMGGVQSLSRSTFSKLLPIHMANTSSFSFYEFVEKTSIVIGTLSFGIINQWAGGMRRSIIALIIYFLFSIVSFIILMNFNRKALSEK